MKGLKPTTGPAAPAANRQQQQQQQEASAAGLVPEASHLLEGQESKKDLKQLPRKKQKGRGSQEECWHQEILEKGRITCPVCRAVVRKTVEGLKKHMANCQQEMFTCHHCGKQLRSLAGMKYHLMADHNSLMMGSEESQIGQESERDSLKRMLKHMRKLRCPREGCTGNFTSVLGYLYHTQKCGKAGPELEKLALQCPHCGKTYRSKAGLVYHLKSEHGPEAPFFKESGGQAAPTAAEAGLEPSGGGSSSRGKVQRKSAKVAAYYLQELASQERAKEWPKRKVLHDLVPDDRKLKYTRPGMPAVSKEVLCKWKLQIKGHKRVPCPNQGCGCAYSSIAGLKSHLGSCSLGEFVAGKYQCLLCEKEFVSESGVKYHINTVHAEDWFDINTNTTKSFEKQMKQQQQMTTATEAAGAAQKSQQKRRLSSRSHKRASKKAPPKKPPRIEQSQQQEEEEQEQQEEDLLRGRQPS